MKKRLAVLVLSIMLPFSAFAADMSCFSVPKNDDLYSQVGDFNKQQFREQKIGEQENPAQDLMGCAMSVTQGGNPANAIKGNCGCQKAIKKLCSFNIKKKRVSASGGADAAFCVPFAPWNL